MTLFQSRDTLTAARLGLATAPQWTRLHDSQLEVDDNWQTATDPDNARGEGCTAFFDRAQVWVERGGVDPDSHTEGWEEVPILKGICIEGGSDGYFTKSYLDREQVEERLGSDWIDEVEEMQRIVGEM